MADTASTWNSDGDQPDEKPQQSRVGPTVRGGVVTALAGAFAAGAAAEIGKAAGDAIVRGLGL